MSTKFIVVALFALIVPSYSIAQEGAAQRRIIALPRPVPPGPPGDGWVWVAPVYRTVYDRVWSGPVYETITENVWLPDRWAWQLVRRWENGVWVERSEWTIVQPGHYQLCTRRVLVSSGGWTYQPRQELVSPGHWEYRGPVPMPRPEPMPMPRPVPPTTGRPAGLEGFSPLWEWPADTKPERK